MENSKEVKVYFENKDIAIRTVLDPGESDLIIKGDGTVTKAVLNNSKEDTIRIYNLDENISKLLLDIGIPAHVKGFRYIIEAVKIILDMPNIIDCAVTVLYQNVAEVFKVNSSKVERCIRNAVELCWNKGNRDELSKTFKFHFSQSKKKPTNSEFLFIFCENIRYINQ